MTTIDKTAADQITKAVSAIVLDDPFFGYLLLRREVKQTKSIDTACTDGQQIAYNPAFTRKLSMAQLKGLLKHEVMHIALEHHLRRGQRDSRKWNEAADHVINNMLIEAGAVLPEGGLHDKRYASMSTEHVYSLLPDEPPGDDEGGSNGSNGNNPDWNWGGVMDAPGAEDEATREAMSEDLKVDLIQAHNAAKVMGKNSAQIDRLVARVRASRMPWRRLLARFFRSFAKNDYNWSRANRRYLAHGIYLPSLHSDNIGPLVVVTDTSASVGTEEHEQYLGAINALLKQTRPESIHVLCCDARVNEVQVFKPDQYPLPVTKLRFRGGGGTDFRPAFEYVSEKKLKPCALLYLTDMEGTFPEQAPSYPVIWCATTDIKGPFGKTVELR